MYVRIVAAIFTILLAACQSTSMGAGDAAGSTRDGLSAKTAIKVSGVPAERAWIERHYPGAKIVSQSLLMGAGPMDLIEIELASGETRRIFFDISSFFGKY